MTPEQAAGNMTPLPRGAVGKWMGWGRGVSALELARWTITISHGTTAPQLEPRHSGSDVQRVGVISDHSITQCRLPSLVDAGRWTLGTGCWMLAN